MHGQRSKNRQGHRFLKEEEAICADLSDSIKEIGWQDLRFPCEEGKVYIVDEDLDLAQVGTEMVIDAAGWIQRYIDNGLLFPPEQKDIELWSKRKKIRFQSIKVHPYILVRLAK